MSTLPPRAEAWLRLALTPGLSPRAAARCVAAAGDPCTAAAWPVEHLQRVAGAGRAAPARRPRDVDVGPVLARCHDLGVAVLTPEHPGWPAAALQGLPDPPCALFLQGLLPPPSQPCLGLVGTRRATPYGQRVARELAETLARAGVCVVSGLAAGIDAAAHAGALRAGRPGATLAVLGCGVAVAYPPENALLRDEIAVQGGLLSEHPPDAPPERWHFPRRNRLVAALVRALVVVEAPITSGALLTAGLALELGREVLAVPGPIGRPAHEGAHRLLKQGHAALCLGAGDLFAALALAPPTPAERASEAAPPPPGPELALWTLLDPDEARDADSLCAASGLPADQVRMALTALELGGRARRVPGAGYLRL